jgi:hypothetical protein
MKNHSQTKLYSSLKKLGQISAFIIALLLLPLFASAISVTISQTGTAANSCTRTLTANVSGGSGSYSYLWSIATPGIPFPGSNTLQTINVGLDQTTDFIVTVTDNVTQAQNSASVTVNRILTGSFSVFIPNVITPNGDGINDTWVVLDAPKVYGPLNAYSFTLSIKNSSNTTVFSNSGTVTTGHIGYVGGDIEWNARVNGTGNIVPVGSYPYTLTLINCSQSYAYTGVIYVFL